MHMRSIFSDAHPGCKTNAGNNLRRFSAMQNMQVMQLKHRYAFPKCSYGCESARTILRLLNPVCKHWMRSFLLWRLVARSREERRDDRAVVGVPDIDLAVERAAGQPLGTGMPGGGEDPVLGPGELANLLLVLGVELPHLVVRGFCQEELAGGSQLVGLAAEAGLRRLLPLGDVPPLQLAVAACRIDLLAFGVKQHAAHRLVVAVERDQELARLGVEDLGRLVAAAGRQLRAVGVPGGAEDPV